MQVNTVRAAVDLRHPEKHQMDQLGSALAWAEEVTRVSETHVSDEAYAAASAMFAEKDLVDLTVAIAAMNAFNRMGVSFRLKPAARA